MVLQTGSDLARWESAFIETGISFATATTYTQIFSREEITRDSLHMLDHTMLKKLGISTMGNMLTILKLAKEPLLSLPPKPAIPTFITGTTKHMGRCRNYLTNRYQQTMKGCYPFDIIEAIWCWITVGFDFYVTNISSMSSCLPGLVLMIEFWMVSDVLLYSWILVCVEGRLVFFVSMFQYSLVSLFNGISTLFRLLCQSHSPRRTVLVLFNP